MLIVAAILGRDSGTLARLRMASVFWLRERQLGSIPRLGIGGGHENSVGCEPGAIHNQSPAATKFNYQRSVEGL